MLTKQMCHKLVDYWFDKTIDKYIPNTRQRFEIATELKIGKPDCIFISDMTVLFHGSWGENNNQTFCKIQINSTFEFTTDNIWKPMVTESLWLFTKHQYHLAVNVFRQQHMGKLTLPCPIDLNAINSEVYEKLKEKYKSHLWFDKTPPISHQFNPYWQHQ